MSKTSYQGKTRTTLRVICCFIALVAVSNIVIFHSLHDQVNDAFHKDAYGVFASAVSKAKDVVAVGGSNKSDKDSVDVKQGSKQTEHHEVAGLSCADHGGPSDEIAEDMVFWSNIESDSEYKSPFYDEEKYITFEPDHGGWNNIRMAMETILVLAHAMGRTLVLPPKKGMYLLGQGEKHQKEFSFNDFFHLDAIAMEHQGLNIITMEEFLTRKGITGQLKSLESGEVLRPPHNRTNWDGKAMFEARQLFRYLERVGKYPDGWEPSQCIAAIPASKDPSDVAKLQSAMDEILAGDIPNPDKGAFEGKPTPVDAPTKDRLKEMMATRKKICIYDSELQKEELIHFKIEHSTKNKARMLTHFYAFVFFQDWKQDLWSKRFVRDHVRYIDEIVCAAARIVHAVREKAKSVIPNNTNGVFNSFHVRRGDFQYKKTRVDADVLYEQSKDELEEGSFLYIATDERDKSFFDPLRKHYQLGFLDDFMHLIEGVNPNYYGMLDQLIAYKGEVFFGTWFSTLSGYVNRMRGYYDAKHKKEGSEDGVMKSYYFVPKDKKDQMRKYRAVKLPIYMREFPVSWRDIDKGIGEV